MATDTKNSKPIKLTLSQELIYIFGQCFIWSIAGTLVFKIINIKKCVAELGHSDVLPVY